MKNYKEIQLERFRGMGGSGPARQSCASNQHISPAHPSRASLHCVSPVRQPSASVQHGTTYVDMSLGESLRESIRVTKECLKLILKENLEGKAWIDPWK